MRGITKLSLALSLALCAGAAADIFPTLPHAANNTFPFAQQASVHHQVFASNLFSSATGGLPAEITSVAFAPGGNITYSANITIRMGYTAAVPGVANTSGGLQGPDAGGNGIPNVAGSMTDFYVNPAFNATFAGAASSNFQMVFAGTPFVYDPAQGNLLVEIVVAGPVGSLSVSRAAGSAESSRAYTNNNGTPTPSPTTALRMDFTFTPVKGGCYANCDESTTEPILNVADFGCFLQKFAANDPYANCDGSTTEPVLNVADFGCFLQSFAAGCR